MNGLKGQVLNFFTLYGPRYLFLVTKQDYNPHDEMAYCCMCFDYDGPNYLVKYFIKRDYNDLEFHRIREELEAGSCIDHQGNFSTIEDLVDHYWDYHIDKLREFFRHVVLKCRSTGDMEPGIESDAAHIVHYLR